MVKNVWSSADVDLTLGSYILFTQFQENYMILFSNQQNNQKSNSNILDYRTKKSIGI